MTFTHNDLEWVGNTGWVHNQTSPSPTCWASRASKGCRDVLLDVPTPPSLGRWKQASLWPWFLMWHQNCFSLDIKSESLKALKTIKSVNPSTPSPLNYVPTHLHISWTISIISLLLRLEALGASFRIVPECQTILPSTHIPTSFQWCRWCSGKFLSAAW